NTFTIKDCSESEAKQIQEVLMALYEVARKNQPVSEQDVIYACRLVARNENIRFDELSGMVIGRTLTGKAIAPKTKGQMSFVKAMHSHAVVFAIGPAGTGKTFLAVIEAVSALKRGDIKRIVLTRPAVEAGESLGFLPGDLKEKVDPYLTPLYDALHDMLGVEQTEKLIEKGTIEIAPLAYMRGRTLDDSFVILDEAQNTTPAQMKMFLTRLGFRSRMVITGDITQIDLRSGTESGLINAARILNDVEEIRIIHLSSDDVVRHPLVQKIIERYERQA
ncbi:MAG: PhoH family protein, partial [Solobacterium sp.]|nr:PhoH family protein [Solobacterium sp.]